MTVFSDPIDLSSPRRPLRARAAEAARHLARLVAAVEWPRLRRPPPAPSGLHARLSDHLLRDLGLTRAEFEGL